MGIFTKDLSDYVRKIVRKEENIKNRILSIESEIQSVETAINLNLNQMVECEVAEDNEGQEKYKKLIDKNKRKLTDLKEMLDPYRQVQKNLSVPDEDLQKIKEVVFKQREITKKKQDEMNDEIQEIEQQIQAQITKLQQKKVKIQEKNSELSRYHTDEKEELLKIFNYLDPLAAKVPRDERNHFIETWINDGDLNQIFKMLKIIENPNHTTNYPYHGGPMSERSYYEG